MEPASPGTTCVLALIACTALAGAAFGQESVLSEDEAKTLKSIINGDKFISHMAGSVEGLDALQRVLGKISGPASLAVTWNDHLIDGYRKANRQLAVIHKEATCATIDVRRSGAFGDNQDFWEHLWQARGCDENDASGAPTRHPSAIR
jgi:hypothetical protein